MDLTESIAPKSDQLNAEDLLSGPRTFTIKEVRKGASAEQPVDVELVEFPGRPFKPSKTVRRIMVGAWGPDASTYAGRRMTLYRDPAVRFGGMDVGGIRVSHMSHIKKPMTLALTVSRGKRAPYVVQPLPDVPMPAPATGKGATRDTASDDQRRTLTSLLKEAGITDKETGLAYIADIVGREIQSTADLTQAEASKAIEQITAEKEPAEPTLPTGAGPVPAWGNDQ